jgi:hypothetical protein
MLRPDLEPVRELRASRALVCELADEQRERLGVSGDPQRARVDRVKSRVVDQPGGQVAGLAEHIAAARFEATDRLMGGVLAFLTEDRIGIE